MVMPQGGYRPAYNLLSSVDRERAVILGLRLTDQRNDTGLAEPMVADPEARYQVRPHWLLVDSTLATQAEIVALAEHPHGPTQVFAPLPPERAANQETLRKRVPGCDGVNPRPARMACGDGRRRGPSHLRTAQAHRDCQRNLDHPMHLSTGSRAKHRMLQGLAWRG
jgi:hypothetical protein